MNVRFLKSNERKRIAEEVKERFGIDKIPSVLIETGKDKVRGFSGTMNREEIEEFAEFANVEVVGLYLFKKEHSLRLSHDAVHIFSKEIDKSILEISKEQAEDWLLGKELEIETKPGVVVIKAGEDFLGCGISNGEKIFNYVPKERRIRRSQSNQKQKNESP